ncbi:MAG: M1 family aminopeptidase [Phycisphaerales bacterium]
MQRILLLALLELRTAWRRPSVWMLLAILLFLTWGFSTGAVTIRSGGSSSGAERAWLNSQFNLAYGNVMVFTLFYCFFACAMFGSAVSDDDALRVGPIIGSTGLTPREYILGRYLGVALVFTAIMALHLLAQMAFFQLYPVAEPEKVRGPFEAWNFVRPMLIFIALPVLSLGAVAFGIGAATRQAALVFVLPVVILLSSIFFVWSFSPEWLPHWINRALQAVDVTGFRWLDRTWLRADKGASFYNTTPIPLDALFIGNRGALVALGAVALGVAAATETRRSRHPYAVAPAEAGRIIEEQTQAAAKAPVRAVDAEPGLARLGMTQRDPGWIDTALAEGGAEARELRRSAGLWIFVPLITLESVGASVFVPGPFDTPLLVTPGSFVAQGFNTVTLCSLLLLLFYFTESLGRDEQTRLAPMVRASAARTTAIIAGKALAIVGVVLAAVLVAVWMGMLIAMGIQTVKTGIFIAPTPWPLAVGWGALLLPTVIAWLGFITLSWALTRNRFATYGLALGALVLTGWCTVRGWMNWVFNWHLWSGLRWTDFGPLQLDRGALAMNRLLWVLMGVLFVWLALQAWRRRSPDAQGIVSRVQPRALWRPGLRFAAFAAAPATLAIALAVMVRTGPDGSPMRELAKQYYRTNAETWRQRPQPAIKAMDLEVWLQPEDSSFRVAGSYVLENPFPEPMARFALTPGEHLQELVFRFDDGNGARDWTSEQAREAMRLQRGRSSVEDSAGLWVFTPPKPLAKGDTAKVEFRYSGKWPAGLRRNPSGSSEFILPAGVVLNNFSQSFLPAVGYFDNAGLDAEDVPDQRRPDPEEWRKVTKPAFGTGGETQVTARVHVPEAYRANLPGVLVSDSVAEGTRTMEWTTDHPVRFFNIVAAKWTEAKGEHTSIWHLPGHEYNVPKMLEALDGARTWYSKWFWPYPWKELRISEFAGLGDYAQGFATNIVFSESIGFKAKPTEEQDTPFMVTAHEAAHQWWGNILMPGDGPGGNILSEGMAHFSTARLGRQLRGDRMRQAFLRELEMTYTERRSADDERPLVEIDGARSGDTTVTYDKGGWVFWMLMNHLGQERMDKGLQAFIGKFKDGPDYPLLQDLVETLRPFAADQKAYDAFVDQWFFDIVVPEFKVVSAETTPPAQAGEPWITRVRVCNIGTGTVPLEVAVTNGEDRWPAPGAKDEKTGEPLDQQAQRAEYREARASAVAAGVSTRDAIAQAQAAKRRADETPEQFQARRAAEETAQADAAKAREVVFEIRSDFEPKKAVVDPDVQTLQVRRKQAEADVKKGK